MIDNRRVDRVTRREALEAVAIAIAGGTLGVHFPLGRADASSYKAAAVGFQVIYNLNGGVNPGGQPLWVAKGERLKVADLLEPMREGYSFAGWYTDAKLTKRATTVVGGKAKKGRRLNARWVPVEYRISYDLAGGSQAAGQRTSYTVETPSFALKTPSREGFGFDGWYADADLTVPVGVVRRGSTGDLELRAKWSVIPAASEPASEVAPGIVELNPGIAALMHQARRRLNIGAGTYEGLPPILTLLHFSDIHAHAENLARIQEFRDHYREFIDDVIHTGDTVSGQFSHGISFWGESCDGTFLNCVGNHDTWRAWNGAGGLMPQADVAKAIIEPWVGSWGDSVSWQPGKTCYFKDYPGNKIRLVVLDCMLSGTEAAEQDAWLVGALDSAKSLGYSVVCAEHYPPANGVKVECAFTSMYRESTPGLDPRYQKTVQSFIDAGGDFCCWLAGHAHCDLVEYNRDYPRQPFFIVTTAQVESFWEDAARIPGDKSQDAFNLVSFDTAAHVVKVVRVGQDRDHLLRHMGVLVFDYATCEVVYND